MKSSDNLGYLLQRVAFLLARQNDQILQEQLGIGFSQYKILMVLGENPSVQQKYIADRLGQTEAGISRQIKILKSKGLLTTRINPENRREHITVPTPKGEKLTERALTILDEYHAPMFESLGAKQKERMLESLNILQDYAGRTEKPSAK